MKRNGLLFGVLFIGMTFLFSDCKKSSGPGQSPQDAQLVKLSKTWIISTATGSTDGVTLDGTPQTGYTSFALTINGTAGQTTFGYSIQGRPPLGPWPASGTFTYGSDYATQLTRDDGLPITYSVTDTKLQMTFNYSGNGFSRVNNVKGNWVFNLSLKP